MLSLRYDLYQLCLDSYDGGLNGNNKFDAELIRTNPKLRKRVSEAVTILAVGHKPDMLLAVPNRANWLAIDVAWNLGVAATTLCKDDETNKLSFYDERDEANIAGAERVIVIEDVVDRRTSVARVLALPGVADKTLAAVGILDRSMPAERLALPVPVECLIFEQIPSDMPLDSPLRMFM